MPLLDFVSRLTGAQLPERYTRVLLQLLEDATRWTLITASGARCSVQLRVGQGVTSCSDHAAGACLSCGLPCCIAHAMIAPNKLLCASCVAGAVEIVRAQGRQGPAEAAPFGYGDPGHDRGPTGAPPGRDGEEEQRRRALEVLGLPRDATADQIRRRYHQLARDHHPDRARGRVAQERAQKRMQEINAAHEWLKRHDPQAA